MRTNHRAIFNESIQKEFALLSGDHNPIHMDHDFARRTSFGNCIVHGIHLLLRGLDFLALELNTSYTLTECRIDFPLAIYVEDSCNYSIDLDRDKQTCRIKAETDSGRNCLKGKIKYSSTQPENHFQIPDDTLPTEVQAQPIEDFEHAKGTEPLLLNQARYEALFPCLSKLVPEHLTSAFLAVTRVVGMKSPGLHSLLASIRMKQHQKQSPTPELSYKTSHCNTDLAFGTLCFKGAGIEIDAGVFYRSGPIRQASFAEIQSAQSGQTYAGYTALVVGGSRGLGEITAKLLAAGGAHVWLTYHSAKDRAEAVAEDIRLHNGKAQAIQYDVLAPRDEPLHNHWIDESPILLFYFATPPIFTCGEIFQPAAFHQFSEYYVSGLARLYDSLPKNRVAGIFYPSTTAIEDLPPRMTEYAASKYAGELLCCSLAKQNKMAVHIARIPRLLTDQTAIPGQKETDSALDVLMNELTLFHQKLPTL